MVAASCFINAASQAFSASRGAIFLVDAFAVEAAGAEVAGLAALVVAAFAGAAVAAAFGEAAGSDFTAGTVDSSGLAAGAASSTVADAFSSVAGAVDSAAGEGDSSWAKVIAARKRVAKKKIMIFMDLGLGLLRITAIRRASYLSNRATARFITNHSRCSCKMGGRD